MKSLKESILSGSGNVAKKATKEVEALQNARTIFKEFFAKHEGGYPIEKDKHSKWGNEYFCNIELNEPGGTNEFINILDELYQQFSKVIKTKKKVEKASVYHETSYYTIEFPKIIANGEPLAIYFAYDGGYKTFNVDVIESFLG